MTTTEKTIEWYRNSYLLQCDEIEALRSEVERLATESDMAMGVSSCSGWSSSTLKCHAVERNLPRLTELAAMRADLVSIRESVRLAHRQRDVIAELRKENERLQAIGEAAEQIQLAEDKLCEANDRNQNNSDKPSYRERLALDCAYIEAKDVLKRALAKWKELKTK